MLIGSRGACCSQGLRLSGAKKLADLTLRSSQCVLDPVGRETCHALTLHRGCALKHDSSMRLRAPVLQQHCYQITQRGRENLFGGNRRKLSPLMQVRLA